MRRQSYGGAQLEEDHAVQVATAQREAEAARTAQLAALENGGRRTA